MRILDDPDLDDPDVDDPDLDDRTRRPSRRRPTVTTPHGVWRAQRPDPSEVKATCAR
jgi:hypothetical protein